MENKLFCSKCGYRIWRNMDDRPFVDLYLQDRHFNCNFALGARPPIRDGDIDHSYTEKEEKTVDRNIL